MDAQRAIARRMVIGLPPAGLDPAWERDFAAYPPAGVIVFRRDFADLDGLRRLTARLRELARPRRLFIAIDEEGGFVSQLAGHLAVPPNALLLARGAAAGDIEWASRVTGERLRSLGIDWVFAPVADVHSEPRNPVIGPRAYGSEPAHVAARVAEAASGPRGWPPASSTTRGTATRASTPTSRCRRATSRARRSRPASWSRSAATARPRR